MQLIAFDVGDDFVVEADLVQVAAAVIQIVDLSAVGQDGGGAVAVEVVVVADGFGNGQVQHIVLRIAPVGFGQAVSGVLFFARHFPLVLGNELAVFVVVEAGKGKRIGKGRLKVISDDLDILLGLDPTSLAGNRLWTLMKGSVKCSHL